MTDRQNATGRCVSRRILRISTAAAVASLALVGAVTPVASAAPKPVTRLTAAQAADTSAWIRSAQLPNGAIASYPDRQHLRPYGGNLAAQGLADHARATGDRASLDAAWAHLRWYAQAEDADGVVTDYDLAADGTMVSTGDEDSTDAYAGTFLTAVEAAYDATPVGERAARLAEVAPGITGALRAISAVTRPDGLTWAKPGWHVVYLMDQAETYAGLTSAARLLTLLGRFGDAVAAERAALRMAVAVDGLWNPATGSYDWAVHESGARQSTDWNVLYPDAMENAWLVAYGLVPAKRAATVMATLSERHPELGDATAAGYWPQAVTAFVRVRDTTTAASVLAGITARADASSRAWPYHTGIAGVTLSLG